MLSSILDVFSSLIGFFKDALLAVSYIFLDFSESPTPDDKLLIDAELSPLGVLAVAALGVSIFFLLVRVVQNFLHFKS